MGTQRIGSNHNVMDEANILLNNHYTPDKLTVFLCEKNTPDYGYTLSQWLTFLYLWNYCIYMPLDQVGERGWCLHERGSYFDNLSKVLLKSVMEFWKTSAFFFSPDKRNSRQNMYTIIRWKTKLWLPRLLTAIYCASEHLCSIEFQQHLVENKLFCVI